MQIIDTTLPILFPAMENQRKLPTTTGKQEPSLPPLVVMVPSMGMGHIFPFTELAMRLLRHQNLLVTILIPNASPPSKAQTTVLNSLPRGISHAYLPPVTLSDIPPTTKIVPIMSLIVLRSLPSLRQALLSLMVSHRVTALVVDLFGTDAFDSAAELNIPSYLYFTSTAMFLSLSFHFTQLDREVQGEFRDLPEPVRIPGCIPVHGKDLFEPVQDRNDDSYKCFLHHSSRFRMAEGIIENSFPELEPGAIELLQKNEPGRPPVYPVGPLVNRDSIRGGEECLKWLDEQPVESVVFVCLGSGGVLSIAQTEELALGLERSEHRFLWAVKCPNENSSLSIADPNSNTDPFGFLPEGFVERTRERGLVIRNWASQSQVLSHASTGGFISNCGWNSILESVVSGVPLVAWPLYAEQNMNAVLVTEGVKVAIRPKAREDGLVERQEIASVVKRLMGDNEEGKKLRCRMKNLMEAAAAALDENGSSTKLLSELALKWNEGKTKIPN